MTLTTTFDLCVLIEEVVDAIYAGQTFRRSHTGPGATAYDHQEAPEHLSEMREISDNPGEERSKVARQRDKFAGNIAVMVNVARNSNWKVRTQPGAIRRIVMNLLGNSLKYTEKGFIQVSLRPSNSETRRSSRMPIDLVVSDSGKGMSEEFLREKLYRPFAQEDPFSVGTGLGLSIVRQIVDSLHGRISVQSEQGKGTEIIVTLNLPIAGAHKGAVSEDVTEPVKRRTTGLTACLLSPKADVSIVIDKHPMMERSLSDMLSNWFGMKVIKADHMEGTAADIFIYAEPPRIDALLSQHRRDGTTPERVRNTPLIVICTNAFEAAGLKAAGIERMRDLGGSVEIVSQPCGPLKMAKVFELCLNNIPRSDNGHSLADGPPTSGLERSELQDTETTERSADLPSGDPARVTANPQSSEGIGAKDDGSTSAREKSRRSSSAGQSIARRPPSLQQPQRGTSNESGGVGSPRTEAATSGPFVLLVDDNPINLQLLVTFVKKVSIRHASAVDGLEALNKFKQQQEAGQPFDYVLMDINMPVMDGLVSTDEMRKFERKLQMKPAKIVALTGLASQTTQEVAFQTGFDHFLPKPVKFKELRKLLGIAE